jgi:hypothetical protein
MSVVLAVDLDPRALQRVPCDLVAAPLFATGLPMRGPAASLDWRLCGLAARTLLSDRGPFALGSPLLAPSRGRMRASWALFVGAGEPGTFGEPSARAWAEAAVRQAAELRVGALGLALAPERLSRLALERSISATVAGAAAALAQRPSIMRLRLIVPAAELNRAEAALAASPRSYPGGVAVRIDRVEPEAPDERAFAGAPPPDPRAPGRAPVRGATPG